MSFLFTKQLPTPEQIREAYPLTAEHRILKQNRDQEIADCITGKSDKFLVIIGPCSADNEDSVCDYVSRLAKINDNAIVYQYHPVRNNVVGHYYICIYNRFHKAPLSINTLLLYTLLLK